ncbi:MAG: Fic family protein, partial [Verrucomicrobiae bacterium]|nr:Fic family protein [Verrucomicrobiae bacterium]
MPPSIPSEDYRAVLSAVAKHPQGIAIGRLLADPSLAFPKRTLQRRLDDLVSSGRLERVGKGRGAHYRMVADVASPVVREDPVEYGGKNWLSQEARQIRTRISQPVTERIPVGYRPEFLASYEPNRTQYLPDSLRGELASLGQVGMSALPAGTYLRQVMDRLLIDLSWNSSRLEGNT